MKYKLIFKRNAKKGLMKVPQKQVRLVVQKIKMLQESPFLGKKLMGGFTGFYSLRVWPYRIIYTVYKKELLVIIVSIGHRQGVYK